MTGRCARTEKAPRRGSPSSSGATSTRRSCGITRTSSSGHSEAELDDLDFPNDPAAFRRVVRGTDRLSDRRCRDAPDQHDRLHAQPAADDHRVVPGQGSAGRLALGRALLRRQADRLRSRVQQRRLAMGRVDRLRRATLFPHLQSGDAVEALRSRGTIHSQATCRSSPGWMRARSTRRGRSRRKP